MDLFNLADSYSGFGYHRTGSDTQLRTEDWIWKMLKTLTDNVDLFDYGYQHFEVTTELLFKGRLIPSMALYYEAVGKLQDCRNIALKLVDIGEDENRAYTLIQKMRNQAVQNKRDALVVATRSANDSLYALNVNPVLKDSIAVVLIPGHEFINLSEREISLNYSASIDQRIARNIIARFGDNSIQAPIVITTPISGWFECAGERGTGVALAIALAQLLSKTGPVELVLASGHELGYLGGFEYTNTLIAAPSAVIHLGSCLATHGAKLEARSNVAGSAFDALNKILQRENIVLNKVSKPCLRTDWFGEAECWSHLNCPMISIAGNNQVFHTPEDRIETVTNESTLLRMFEVLSGLAGVIATTI